MFKISAKNLSQSLKLATMAMFVALYVVLYAVKIPITPESRISVTFIPVALCGYLLGPVPAMLVGGIGDVVAFFLFPSGAYFPGFTVSAILSGMVYGCLLYKSSGLSMRVRVVISKIIITVCINMILNTLWTAILYEKAFFVLLFSRVLKNLITMPFQIIITIIFIDIMSKCGVTKKYL